MRFAIALVAVLAACAVSQEERDTPRYAPPPSECARTFTVSPDFTPDERAAIDRAASRFNAIALEQFCLVDGFVERYDTRSIFRVEYGGEDWKAISKELGDVDFIGVHYNPTDLIVLAGGLPIDQFERVAIHEFGHSHGLGHIPPPAMMAPHDGSAEDFTEKDIAECRRVEACL